MTSARRAPQRQRGYMLLFALGLLVVASTFILAVTASQRIDVQLLTHEKKALQNQYVLEGAAEYTATQLTIAAAVATQRIAPDDAILREWMLWRPDAQPYTVELGGKRLEVLLQDQTGLPDANMLTPQEWEKLFFVVGAPNPGAARELANQLLAFKSYLGKITGTASFASMQELLGWRGLTAEMIDGGTERVPLGLRQLLTIGTLRKDVHIDLTPLPIFRVLGNVNDEQLRRLAELRRSGPVQPSEGVQWIQGTGLSARFVISPTSVTARISLQGETTLPLVFTIASHNGTYKVVDRAQLPLQ